MCTVNSHKSVFNLSIMDNLKHLYTPIFDCTSRTYCITFIVIIILLCSFDFSVTKLWLQLLHMEDHMKSNGDLKIDSDNFKHGYRKVSLEEALNTEFESTLTVTDNVFSFSNFF